MKFVTEAFWQHSWIDHEISILMIYNTLSFLGSEEVKLRFERSPDSPSSHYCVPYSAYISRVFNFMNFVTLELFTKFIQQKFEPLHCNTHGQHEFAKFIQRIPSKQLFTKI